MNSEIEMWSEGANVITVSESSLFRPDFQMKFQCECCGIKDIGGFCQKCFHWTCERCITMEENWGYCLLCGAKVNGDFLTAEKRLQLEKLYQPGGFQFEKAKNKIDNLFGQRGI